MGVVAQTVTGLYGYHNMPGRAGRIAALNTAGQPISSLYTACRWLRRYPLILLTNEGSFSQWVTEVKALALALGYHGPVTGLNLSGTNLSDGLRAGGESAYVEYILTPADGSITVKFSLTSNVTPTTVYDLGTAVRRVDQYNQTSVPYLGRITSNVVPTLGQFSISDNEAGVCRIVI